MLKAVLSFIVFAVVGLSASVTPAAEPTDVDALIRKLEQSGALDAAIDRGIQRFIQRQNQARQEEQERQQKRQAEAAKNARPVSASRDHIFGNAQAPVSVIVYSDMECPFCKQFAGTPEMAIGKFNGNANLVFRHFPLDFHGENAKLGARLAECVARQASSKGFFTFVNDWFKQTASNGKGLERGQAQIREIALSAGVKDLAGLESCSRESAIMQLVQDDLADGTRAGITGTPGTIVRNNKTGVSVAITGAVPAQRLEEAITQVMSN